MNIDRARLRLVLIYAVAVVPLVAWGASHALDANNNSPIDWVTSDFAPRKAYDAHCSQFGPGDTVMVSWPGCTIEEPSLDQLVKVLRTAKVFHQNGTWLFANVTSGRELALAIARPVNGANGPSITMQDVITRLQGHLIGLDGKSTAVVVTFTADGLKQRKRLVRLLRLAAQKFCGVPDDQLHLAGPVIDGLSVDDASQATLTKYAVPSSAIVLLLCWLNLRSFRAALVVFGLAVFCQGATLALVYYSGESMSALLIVLPPLIQVIAVAGGVHLTNYYFDLGSTGTIGERVAAAVRGGWLPCTLSAGTTAIGMASLMVSKLEPIRAFGAYSSAGVLLTLGVLLGLIPACYLFWPPGNKKVDSGSNNIDSLTPVSSWTTWGRMLGSANLVIVCGGVLLIILGGWYATRISTSVRIETMFGSHHRVIEDYAWLEKHIGPLVPLEVALAFDRSSTLSYRDKLSLLWELGKQLEAEKSFSHCLSAASFFPPVPGLSALPHEQQDEIMDQVISRSLPLYEQLGLLKVTDGVEHWRLTTRTSALGSANYGTMLDRVQEVVDHELGKYSDAAKHGLTTNTTGIMPLVHSIQGQLLSDLMISFAEALVLITLVMTLVQGGILFGLLAMLPNVFPIAICFGFLGWRGMPIDIGVVMTASIALGIAVDDTFHFLTFYHRAIARGNSRKQAIDYALNHCGPAMVQTSVSCGLGLLVFALSDFLPTSRFATSMTTLLALALAGDLILLPALLLSPLGKICSSHVVPESLTSDTSRASAPVSVNPPNKDMAA